MGDSHADYCFSKSKHFRAYRVGPNTAYKLRDHHDKIMHCIKRFKRRETLFIFGEIDCRLHIWAKAKSVGVGCYNTAKRYAEYVNELNSSGFNISIISTPPQGYFDVGFYGKGIMLANWKRRVMICELLNFWVKRFCDRYNIVFYNIYPKLITKGKQRRKELIEDDNHLNYKVADILWQEINKI